MGNLMGFSGISTIGHTLKAFRQVAFSGRRYHARNAAHGKKVYETQKADGEELRAQAVKALEEFIQKGYAKGYNPTPENLVQLLIEKADIQPGMRVLEPSAGKGNIASPAFKRSHRAVTVIEPIAAMAKLFKFKTHAYHYAGSNFMQFWDKGHYDRILMNPPFECRQDIQHIVHAYQMLKNGGRLVSILSENAFVTHPGDTDDYVAVIHAFEQWLQTLGADIMALPKGAFDYVSIYGPEHPDAPYSTPIGTCLIVVNKPKALNPSDSVEEAQRKRQIHQATCELDKVFKHYWFNELKRNPTLRKMLSEKQ